jgi:hypothetical protein
MMKKPNNVIIEPSRSADSTAVRPFESLIEVSAPASAQFCCLVQGVFQAQTPLVRGSCTPRTFFNSGELEYWALSMLTGRGF